MSRVAISSPRADLRRREASRGLVTARCSEKALQRGLNCHRRHAEVNCEIESPKTGVSHLLHEAFLGMNSAWLLAER